MGGRSQRSPSPNRQLDDPALIAGLEVLQREECLSLLRAIDCPVLLIHGTEDRICPYGAAEELVHTITSSRVIAFTRLWACTFYRKGSTAC